MRAAMEKNVTGMDELLAGYAAGTLSYPAQALVGAHLELTDENRGYVSSLETLAGVGLDACEPVALADRDTVLSAIMNADSADLNDNLPEALTASVSAPRVSAVPGSLRTIIGDSLDDLPWKTLLPGVKECKFDEIDGCNSSLLWVRAGRAMPSHTHHGTELTLVLKGGFRDEDGHYVAGDLAYADGDVDHKPIADEGEDCICFAVTAGRLELTGPVGRCSGIGRQLALDLARAGWTVAVTARSEDALTELVGLADTMLGKICPFAGDVTDTDLMGRQCSEIENQFGPISLLVANAGIYLPQDGLSGEASAYRKSFDVNLMGTVNVLLPCIETMKARGRGQIAVVSSVAGYGGLPTSAAYGATKAGLINMVEALKFDLDLAGIRIQLVNPGFVDTPATKSNPFPMPHLMTVEDAAQEMIKGLQHPNKFEIAFPRPFVRQLKFLQLLPYRAYFAVLKRTTGWANKEAG
eukprot:g1541.t1